MRSADGPTKAPLALPVAGALQVLQVLEVPFRLMPELPPNCAKVPLPLAFQVVAPTFAVTA